MDDRLRQYLRQQAELGGVEIYLGFGGPVALAEVAAPAVARESMPTGSLATLPPPPPAAVQEPVPTALPRTAVEPPEMISKATATTASPEAGAASIEAEPASSVATPEPADEPGTAAQSTTPSRRSRAKWMRELPPIPGPGLSVMPPALELLGNDVHQLTSLEAVAERIAGCRACRLCEGRAKTVPGEGNPSARLMCVGEGPGQKEDETGRPFVGAAGQLLDQILEAIDCPRETVYIANIVKCRPPGNRTPAADEIATCMPYLRRQIELIQPKLIVALGKVASNALLGRDASLAGLRGKVHDYRVATATDTHERQSDESSLQSPVPHQTTPSHRVGATIPLIVTYHPAYLLRSPTEKAKAWQDLCFAVQERSR